jgi:predicted kinase
LATLHLMVGLPCSGKTTLARQLEQQLPALRLTPDDWQLRLFGQDFDHPEHDARHDLIEALLWELAARALVLGADVILDFGFWSRAERASFRARAAVLGAACMIHYCEAPMAVLVGRLAARNAQSGPGEVRFPETMLHEWARLFEPPSPDELTA